MRRRRSAERRREPGDGDRGVLRGVRQLGLRALALTLAAMLLLNLAVLVAAWYLGDGDGGDIDGDLLAGPVIRQAAAAAELLDGLDDAQRAPALRALNSPMIRFRLLDEFDAAPPVRDPKPVFVPIIEAYGQRLGDRPFTVYVRDREAVDERWWRPNHAMIVDDIVIVLRLADGAGLSVEPGASYRRRLTRVILVTVVGVVGLVLVGLMAWASVSYARPLARLSAAAARASDAHDAEPMPETGPKPVRDLARTLNQMRARLRGLMAERATTLAAVAHDMRTYLTRLRMRAEFIEDDDQQARAVRDLEDMTRLLDDALSLGEAAGRGAERAPLSLPRYLAEFIDRRREAAPGAALTLTLAAAGEATVATVENDLERVLNNLVDNALRYAGSAEIRLSRAGDARNPDTRSAEAPQWEIAVLDEGPGAPEEMLERLTEPFTRLERSRSRDTGGAGLGLAIAKARAERAGAVLRLANRPGGGLVASVRFQLD